MTISTEAWAIVAATCLGPVFAVAITLWREKVSGTRNRRLHVFRALMATRRMPISNEHVNAINLIEVDFYKCADVDAAWQQYKTHLYAGPEDEIWLTKRDKLLATVLFQMGKVLGFDMPAMELFQGGYAPEGWAYRDNRSGVVAEYMVALSEGKASVPMNVVGFPVDKDIAETQADYFKLLTERMREGKAWRVEIVNDQSGAIRERQTSSDPNKTLGGGTR